MKKIAILILLASLLAWSTGVLGFTLPMTKRCNGDPDEFQACKVIGEGGLELGMAPAVGPSGRQIREPENARRPVSGHKTQPTGRNERTRVSITLSGKTFFLEK